MSTGNWMNKDNLYLEFGTTKAVVDTGGDYKTFGDNRVAEVLIDLTTLTSTAAIQSQVLFFPSGVNIFIEKVQVVAEVGATVGTSFSVGLIQDDRATIPSGYSTAFINAEVTATIATAGMQQTYFQNTTHAGGLIGSTAAAATGPGYYITALAAGTFSTGKVRVRIFYHGIGTISQ